MLHTRCSKRESRAKRHVRRSQAACVPFAGYLRNALVPTLTFSRTGRTRVQHGPEKSYELIGTGGSHCDDLNGTGCGGTAGPAVECTTSLCTAHD